MSAWDKVLYFKKDSKTDNWGDPDLIEDELLLKIDRFRYACGSPVIITSGAGGKHREGSFHYKGQALDLIILNRPKIVHPIDAIFKAFKCGFTGIGYYPDWRYHGMQVGGYHLDIGDRPGNRIGTWMGVLKPDSKGIKLVRDYIALDHQNLKRYV